MLDASNTSPEWRAHGGDIIVLAVGSMEQHAAHLPLNTDSVHAERFARIVAEHFDAALLPTVQIANSFEHSGFRGTFSLRPETLMQIVRDLADEAETQDFRFMIVVNGHGANFVLAPVCRDINRRDRRLKVLLISSWEFAPGGITKAQREGNFDVHSGDNETTGMLAVAPEVVRPRKPGPEPEPWDPPFRRGDLNAFGVRYYSPGGNLGDYNAATAENGRKMTDAAIAPMLRYLEDRIERLRRRPGYAG